MSQSNSFHLSTAAAELYENSRVPAIFAPMAAATLDAIDLPARADVLDVACGTGVMARAIAARLSQPGRIVGCDLNAAMIEVARRTERIEGHEVDWIVAPAEAMPLEAGSFDMVFCQHGLQFFPDKPAALGEMRRLLRLNGRLILTCWRAIPPFFAAVAEELGAALGPAPAAKAVEPFVWNDAGEIAALIDAAGFTLEPPAALLVQRRIAADVATLRAELLSTPNEAVLRAAGAEVIDDLDARILARVDMFRQGDVLVMPQEAHLFQASAC